MTKNLVDSPATQDAPGSGAVRQTMETKLQTLVEMLDNAPNSITIHTPDGRFLYANRKTFELHGCTESEFLAMTVHQVDLPTDSELYAQRLRQIVEQGCATFEVEHYRKDHSVLPLEVTAKQVLWEGSPAVLSIATDLTENRDLQVQSMRHTRDLTLFQLFVVGLATTPADEIHRFIAQRLKEFTGAYFVSISDYEPTTRRLAHRHLDIDPGMAGRLIQFLGSRVEDIHTPLTEEQYELVTKKGWSIEKSLSDASFGSIPGPVAMAMQKWLQLDRFIGITFLSGDRLYGTSLMAMQKDQPEPSMDMLQAYRHAASIALRQCKVEQERQKLEEERTRARPLELKGRLIASVAPDLTSHLERIHARSEAVLARIPADDPARVDLEEIRSSAKITADLITQLEKLEP